MAEATAWRFHTGAPWRDLPERFGNWNTIYKTFGRWSKVEGRGLGAQFSGLPRTGGNSRVDALACAYVLGMIVFRPSARALITDPDDRILLLRVRDAVALNASDSVTNYWITVGGGVEPGESFETAIVREIFEETGHVIDDPGPCIWRRRKSITDAAGVTRASDERYFWCPVSSAELTATT